MIRGNSQGRLLCIVVACALLFTGAWLLAGCGRSSQSPVASQPTATTKSSSKPAQGNSDPTGNRGQVGKISLPNDGNNYTLYLLPVGSRQNVTINGKSGQVTAPVGRYKLTDYVARPGKSMKNYVLGHPNSEIKVTAGVMTQIAIGGPYTVQITARKLGRNQVSMSLAAADSAGNQCSVVTAKPPGFEILSSSGQVLQRGSFQYG